MPRRSRYPLPNPLFAEPVFSEGGQMLPDPENLLTPHPSDKATYDAIQKLLEEDTVPFEASRIADAELFSLQDALGARGADYIKFIEDNKKIVFHCLGDSGASQAGRKYREELTVMDAMSQDCITSQKKDRPAFLYHLGDLVYNFGESKYYYDQFYEPLRNYPCPVFAIPGNHDSFIVPGTDQSDEPLAVFCRNFCATQTRVTVEAGSLHRTAMTQPGVYFTLDAPFVRIIGLFSNSLEDPGLISSEGGTWKNVPDFQLTFLRAQLSKIREENYEGAVILAMHHPPFCYAPQQKSGRSSNHGSNLKMLKEIDTICKDAGVYPHTVLSGHAHNYQRFTRTIQFPGAANEYEVPFIVCGNGGHNVTPLVYDDYKHKQDPKQKTDVSYIDKKPAVKSQKLLLNSFDDYNYGYLTITVDKKKLHIHLTPTSSLGHLGPDDVTVDLATHRIV